MSTPLSRITSLSDLLAEEIAELSTLERHLLQQLPPLIATIEESDLRYALVFYLRQIDRHLQQLTPLLKASTLNAAEAAATFDLKEDLHTLDPECSDSVREAALIFIVTKVEHYLTAGYLNACAYARLLKQDEIARLLLSRLEVEAGFLNCPALLVRMLRFSHSKDFKQLAESEYLPTKSSPPEKDFTMN